MKTYQFKNILQKDGWHDEKYITVGDDKIIQSISAEKPEGEIFPKEGFLIPGFQNAHSHAFQYTMAGLNEGLGSEATTDDFWSWRENMYGLALNITPEEMEEVATKLYCEMVRHGYTHVAEFHYLHHDKEGNPYSNISEMGERIMNAATAAGIGLTLVPMFYQMGGFNLDPNERQRRFITKDLDEYKELYEATVLAAQNYKNITVGCGLHSLRAVKPVDILEFFKWAPSGVPKHLHISEQELEVRDCVSNLGERPVQWLLDNVKVNEEFHLVHATHLDDSEISGLIKSKANVVLCPSTEANLGDGLFPLLEYHRQGGQFCIGTDSHIGLSPMEELRWLDYGVRLIQKKRNPLCLNPNDDSGELLFHMAIKNGRKAMGNSSEEYFEVGKELSGVLIKNSNPLFENKPLAKILSTLIYSAGPEHLERL